MQKYVEDHEPAIELVKGNHQKMIIIQVQEHSQGGRVLMLIGS